MGFFDFGRKFINGLPIVGGITSNLWGDPSQEGVQDAYQKAQEEQAKQRAYMMDARMNAMGLGMQAFGPRNEMLGEMMGKGPGQNAMDLNKMAINPMSSAQQQDIRNAAFGNPQQAQQQQMQQPQQSPPYGMDPRQQTPPWGRR